MRYRLYTKYAVDGFEQDDDFDSREEAMDWIGHQEVEDGPITFRLTATDDDGETYELARGTFGVL